MIHDLHGMRRPQAYGRRRREHQQGFALLTPAVEAHLTEAATKQHPPVLRFECARNPQGGTVTVATARRLYARGSGECSACRHQRDCSNIT